MDFKTLNKTKYKLDASADNIHKESNKTKSYNLEYRTHIIIMANLSAVNSNTIKTSNSSIALKGASVIS